MRWLGFVICAVIVLTLQTTVAWRLDLRGARPDWLLVLAIFFALHARSADALIGAWLLGAAADVMSIERFGLLSGCYGLATLAVYAVRDYVFRDNPLAHFVLTFAAAAAVGAATMAYRGAVVDGGWRAGAFAAGGSILLGAAYTAVWAPLVHYVLLKFPRALGVRAPRRSYRPRWASRARHV
jgi:rod shape-determining protein MreD